MSTKDPIRAIWKVFENGRNGDRNPKKAYNGTNSRKFYQTPDAFFTGKEVSVDAADTTRESVGVLDRNGRVRICRASGVRVFLPPIKGIGSLRQRYPIMPVHGEGSAVWKELEAMKDLLLQSKTYGYLFREPLGGSGVGSVALPERSLTLQMEDATRTPPRCTYSRSHFNTTRGERRQDKGEAHHKVNDARSWASTHH